MTGLFDGPWLVDTPYQLWARPNTKVGLVYSAVAVASLKFELVVQRNTINLLAHRVDPIVSLFSVCTQVCC